jgi:AcrR family transcriptional regulator
MPTPRRERLAADDTRSLLVAAFVEFLKTRSLESISVREVAAAAGVNHGLVHRYFGSKAALVEAAVQQVSEELHRGTPEHAGMSAATFATLRQRPELARLVARACLDDLKDLLGPAAPPRVRLEEIVRPIRAAAERAGAKDVDPYLLNALASSALLGWFVFKPLLEKGFGLRKDADDQLAALLARLDALVVGLAR